MIGLIVWTLIVDNLLDGLVPGVGALHPRSAPAPRSPPARRLRPASTPRADCSSLGYVAAFVAAGALLVARRDVT